MDKDMLTMWQCIVAIAHADGKVHDKERLYLQGIFSNMERVKGLSASERALLEKGLDVQQDPFELLQQITSPNYRAQVLYFALYLAKVDGVIDPSEQDLIDRLHATVTGSVSPALREQARIALETAPVAPEPDGIAGFVDDLMSWSGR